MKDTVFIAWSGSNEYAEAVSKKLQSKGYHSIVGGNSQTPDSLFIGSTIIKQMDECSQAIFLFQKKPSTQMISSNLFFEFGYMINKLAYDKIFVYYIDVAENDVEIPTDLRGMWTTDFLKSNDDIGNSAQFIADKFIKSQKHVIKDDKLNIVSDWYYYKNIIETSVDRPQCTYFEIAQYLLFYTQAVYFNDDFDETDKLIEKIYSSVDNLHGELQAVLRYCKLCFKLYKIFFSKTNNVLTKSDALNIVYQFEDILDDCEDLPETEFKCWLYASIYENIGFTMYHYLMNDNNSDENNAETYKNILEYNRLSLEHLDRLTNGEYASAQNVNFANLFRAYVYAQSDFANKRLYEIYSEDKFLQESKANAANAFKMWRALYNGFLHIKTNSRLADNIELNYYLMMSKVLDDKQFAAKKGRYLNEINNYLTKQQNKCDVVTDYLDMIKNNLA